MNEKKGLESLHRWKKEYKSALKEVKDIKKKIESMNDRATEGEIRIYEKKLYKEQERVSILEKKMFSSWL
jgi:hypothetical protein